jgi:hypothetical protein
MILSIFLTDTEIKEFFEKKGYKTKLIELTTFSTAYHNREVEHSKDVLHVLDGTEWMPAKEIFERELKTRILNL